MVWQCNQKYKNEVRCTTPFLDEVIIRSRFIKAANLLLAGRKEAIAAYEAVMATALDTSKLETQQAEYLLEMQTVQEMINQLIRQNAAVAQDQAAYQRQYKSMSQRFHEAENRHKEVTGQISDIVTRRGTMESCLNVLRKQKGELTEFSEDLWCRLLDYATIYHDGQMTFTFKTGQTFDG